MPTEVIGSLAEGMETYLCKKKEQKTLFQLDLFCFGEISNSYLASLVKKKVHVLPKFFTAIFLLNEFLSRYIFFIKKHNERENKYEKKSYLCLLDRSYLL